MRDECDQLFAQLRDAFAEPAFELLGGRAQREIGLRADQVDDRFGLGEIHLAIEVSALGKFAWPRRARARAAGTLPRRCAVTSTPPWQLISTTSSPV